MFDKQQILNKYLRFLLAAAAAELALLLLSPIAVLSSITDWCSLAVSFWVILTLFRLRSCNRRYQNAALFLTVSAMGTAAAKFAGRPILTLAAAVCSIISSYYIYSGHSEIAADCSEQLSHQWRVLFRWNLITSAALTILNSASDRIAAASGAVAETRIAVNFWAGITTLAAFAILRIVYLLYLRKTCSCCTAQT